MERSAPGLRRRRLADRTGPDAHSRTLRHSIPEPDAVSRVDAIPEPVAISSADAFAEPDPIAESVPIAKPDPVAESVPVAESDATIRASLCDRRVPDLELAVGRLHGLSWLDDQ